MLHNLNWLKSFTIKAFVILIFFSLIDERLFAGDLKDSVRSTFYTIYYSPDYCSAYFPNGVGSGFGYPVTETKKPVYGNTIGIIKTSPIRKSIFYSIGFQYSKKGYFLKHTYPYSTMIESFRYSVGFLELPCRIIYSKLHKHSDYYFSIGASLYMVNKSTETIGFLYNGQRNYLFFDHTSNEKAGICYLIGFGTKINVSKKVGLTFNPEFRRLRKNLNIAHNARVFYSLGVNVGLTYKF